MFSTVKLHFHLEQNFFVAFSEGPSALMVAVLIGQMVTLGLCLSFEL
jgi:hypothetical protein